MSLVGNHGSVILQSLLTKKSRIASLMYGYDLHEHSPKSECKVSTSRNDITNFSSNRIKGKVTSLTTQVKKIQRVSKGVTVFR